LACSTKTHRNFSIIYTVRDCSKHLLGNEELLQVKIFTEGDLTKTIPIPVDDIPQGLPASSFPPWAGIACRTTEEERKFYSATNGIQRKTRSQAKIIQAIDEKKCEKPLPLALVKVKEEPGTKRVLADPDPNVGL
jgi:hypothetical protein